MKRNGRACRTGRLRAVASSVAVAVWAGVSISVASADEPVDPAATWVAPPPINVDYLQFGVAFVGDFALNPGPVCPAQAKAPCVLGSGGGLRARAGYRSPGPWYVGGSYGFSKLETNGLMRLGILQQAAAETRYLLALGQRTEPYVAGGLGAVAFGNEWWVDTGGVAAHVGAGFEVQLERTTVVGMYLSYRPTLLFGWTDRAGQDRTAGVAHFVGLDVVMEARQPLRTH